MKKIALAFIVLFSFGAMASVELQSGDYGVSLRDRNGNTVNCTLEIENYVQEQILTLTIQDCPPPVNNVALYYYEEDQVYMSDKIPATTRRGGFKLYEIEVLSSTQFKMTSHREYGDGGVGRPRSITATLK